MDFRLSEEEKLIQETAAQFVHREMLTRERDFLRQAELFSSPGDPPRRTFNSQIHEILATIARRIGLWAPELAPSGTGEAMSHVARVLVYREFGRAILPFEPATIPALMAETSLAKELTEGRLSLTLAFDEVHRTGTLIEIGTQYTETADGFALSDTDINLLNPGSDYLLLPAREKTSGRIGLFMIHKDDVGVIIDTLEDLNSDATSGCLKLFHCEMPRDRLIGGATEIETIIASQQLRIAARCLGIATRCVADAIEHARNRVTFGRPLAQRQAIQWMLADLSTDISTCNWLTLDAAWRADNNLSYFHAAALAKKRAAKTAFQAADTAIQIHGGYGVCKEFPFEGFYRESRLMRMLYGREAEIDRGTGERFLNESTTRLTTS